MEIKDIIKEAKNNDCIVVSKGNKYYYIVCDFMDINGITFSDVHINLHQIDNTIYFGAFWIDKNDIKSIGFTGHKSYDVI